MAFYLLAASASSSARDDALLFLQTTSKHRRARRLPAIPDNSERDGDDDSANSLPPSWNSQVDTTSSGRSKKDHHHRHSLWSFWKKPFTLPSRSNTLTTTKKETWRQRRHIRASADEIQSAVETRIKEALFLSSQLQQQNQETPLLRVSRHDLTLRYWLGHGGFCKVWEVQCKNKAFGAKKKNQKMVFKHTRASLLPRDRHHDDNHHRSSPYQNHTTAFVHGAIDLRMEALYLSHLQHPNIIQLIGLVQPAHGLLPFRDGRHDGFGLLLEPLMDTLDQRMEDWRRTSSYYYYHDKDDSASAVSNHTTTSSSSAGCLFHGHNIFSSSSTLRKVHLGRVLNYASQLADALQYLHDRRIVMCDVKPSNVGFISEHQVRLFDLGLCRELPPPVRANTGIVDVDDNVDDEEHRLYELPTAGTPTYLPGEVLHGGRINCLTDVYSWAIVLYEMLTLQRPYEALTPSEHYERVAKRGVRPPLNNDKVIPLALHALLTHAWDPDVSKRWTMRQVRDELARLQETLDIISPTAGSSSTPRHHRRKRSLEYLDLEVSSRHGGDNDNEEEEEEAQAMTADDFELLFTSNKHGD